MVLAFAVSSDVPNGFVVVVRMFCSAITLRRGAGLVGNRCLAAHGVVLVAVMVGITVSLGLVALSLDAVAFMLGLIHNTLMSCVI